MIIWGWDSVHILLSGITKWTIIGLMPTAAETASVKRTKSDSVIRKIWKAIWRNAGLVKVLKTGSTPIPKRTVFQNISLLDYEKRRESIFRNSTKCLECQ